MKIKEDNDCNRIRDYIGKDTVVKTLRKISNSLGEETSDDYRHALHNIIASYDDHYPVPFIKEEDSVLGKTPINLEYLNHYVSVIEAATVF